MSSVVVTGGLGESGRWIVDAFVEDGWDVTVIDQRLPDAELPAVYDAVDFRRIDLTDGAAVLELVHDVDPTAVVHWAAFRSEDHSAPGVVFSNNVLSTYYTLTAAGQVGCDAVIASSDAVYGYEQLPSRFPITTDEQCLPSDAYALSKLVSEEIGRLAARKFGLDVRAIRTTWIQYPGEYDCLDVQQAPEYGTTNYWSYCDVRDVVSGIQRAVEASIEGFCACNVIAADNYVGRPTSALLEEYFDEPTIDADLTGDASVYATERTEELLDWSPSHSWKTAADEEPSCPPLA